MPSVVEAPPPSCVSKKRRRDDDWDGLENRSRLSSPYHRDSIHENSPTFYRGDSSNLDLHARRIFPKPTRHDSKRQRLQFTAAGHDHNNDAPIKAGASQDVRNTSMGTDTELFLDRKQVKMDLNPCHICRRKPMAKQELDDFANCESCGKRTCYICIRECLGVGDGLYERINGVDYMVEENEGVTRSGPNESDAYNVDSRWENRKPHGHSGRICSQCCIERGTDGEVWCLGCLRTESGG